MSEKYKDQNPIFIKSSDAFYVNNSENRPMLTEHNYGFSKNLDTVHSGSKELNITIKAKSESPLQKRAEILDNELILNKNSKFETFNQSPEILRAHFGSFSAQETGVNKPFDIQNNINE